MAPHCHFQKPHEPIHDNLPKFAGIDIYPMKPNNSRSENPQELNEAARHIGLRAENLFLTRQLWCSAAVLVTLNNGLKGGMPDELAVRLSSGFGDGLAGGGCICGSLSGGVLALSLFLGDGCPGPLGNRRVLSATRQLHEHFKKAFGSTCCRVLTRRVEKGSKKDYGLCVNYTSHSARWTAEIILRHRPDLIHQVDWAFLSLRESRIAAQVKTVFHTFNPISS